MSEIPFKNPGWAGNVGEYDLTEEQVRGIDFVGVRPLEGGHPAGSATYPYMLEDKHPDAPLFEGPYEARFEKILTRYPTKRAALLPVLNLSQEIRGHVSPQTMDRVWGTSRAFIRVRARGGDLLHDVQQAPGRAAPRTGMYQHQL